MFTNMALKPFPKLTFISIFSASLAACGGGNSDSVVTPPPTPVQVGAVITAPAQATEFTTIKLDGNQSTQPEGATLTYSWMQIAGPETVILSPDAASTDIELPVVEMTTNLTFELSVTDGSVTDVETVVVSVAKTSIPAPQGAALMGMSYPQDRPFTSIGIAQRSDEDTGVSRSLVFLARPNDDGSAGEIMEFNPQSNQFLSLIHI